MAVAPSSQCVPRLNRALPHHSAASFSTRAPVKSVSFLDSTPAAARLVSVRSSGSDRGDVSLIRDGAGEVGSKASGSPSSSSSSAAYAIDFLTLCHSLKTTKRKGWINHGINGPESIADHMYRMALMSLIAGDLPGVNRERCIKIAIVHDIAEAIVGDITPSDGVPKEEKSRREQAALLEMCKVLGGGMRAEEIQELWREYEDNASKEAKLVKDFDKVEMILQALEYEMGTFLTEHGKVLDEFFQSTAGKFQTDIGKKWAAEVNSRRTARLADDSHIN